MAKRYHRKKLNQAIAAACLTVTAIPAINATPALAVTVSSSTYTVNMGSGNPGQVILGNSGSLIVATTDDGGIISGSNPGVLVTGGATAGSISNSGSISGDLAGILITDGSDVSGGITNAVGATIQGTSAISAVGINISSSVMTGEIVNNGTISGGTGDTVAAGIKVANSSDIIGGIVNTGTVSGYAGILVKSNSDISGGITNGDIDNASAAISGNQTGIYVGTTSNITGGISNFGTISGGQRGIKVEGGSTIGGSITNEVGGTIRGSGSGSAGIYIQSSTITGAINNSGDILGPQYGIYVGNGSTIGSITNEAGGYIAGAKGELYVGANLAGIYITDSEVTGNISNSGTIMGGAGIYVGSGSAIGGDITNGDIDNASAAISGNQTGIYVGTTSNITGGISNFGTISGGQRGIRVEGGSTFGGGITNNEGGTISGSGSAGIYIQNSTITGGINNSGDILGQYYGIYVGNGSTIGGITNNAGATIRATTSSSSAGIYLTESTVSGNIANSGIISGPMGLYVISSTIEGNISNDIGAAAISGSQTGIALSQSSITGGISNSGTISGGRTGIYVRNNSEISGGIINYADATIQGVTSAGIDIQNSIVGNITNSGEILGQNYGLYIDNSTIGGITNNADGTITGTNIEGISIQNSTVSGDIINAGVISGVNNGIYIGSSTVGEIINSGTIHGDDYAIKIMAPVNPIIITNTGILEGMVELADGTLNLNGPSGSITGAVTGVVGSTVNVNGTFTTENTFAVDAFNIASGGIFNMAHGVTATSGVSNGGTLSVAAGDTATITGDYTQTANGIFQTGASSLANYGKLVVTGTADLTASNKIDVKVGAGDTLANGNVLTSILSAGTLSAGALTVTDNSAVWNFTGTVNGNAIDLTTEQALTFVDAVSGGAVTPAAAGVGKALDAIQEAGASGDMQTVLNALGSLGSANEVGQAVSQLMPGFAGGGAQVALGLAGSSGSQVVSERMSGGQGLSSGDPLFKDRMVWAQPFYSWTDQNERKGVAGYTADSHGLALGADGKVNEQWRIGAALSLAKGEVDGDSPVTRNNLEINTYQVTLYATDQLSKATSLNLQAGFGVNDNDSSRHIVFGGLDRIASGDYTSWHTLLDAELEHRYTVSEKASLASYLRAQYTYVNVEDYTETGAGAINLHMDSNSEDSLILSVGGRAAYALTDGVKLTGHLGAGYDLMASQASVSATFAGGGPTFVTEGLDPASLVLQGGLGFEMLAANGLTVTARYDVDGREDYTNQVASLKFQMPF